MAAGGLAGIFHVQMWFVNSDGYMMGTATDPDNVAVNTTLHAYKVPAPVSATLPAIERTIATHLGGQTIVGQRYLGIGSIGSFEMTLATLDETFNSYVTASAVDATTATAHSFSAPNTQRVTLPTLGICFTTAFTNVNGAAEYLNIIYPSVQISSAIPGANQEGGVNPNPLTYTVVPTPALRTPMGLLFSAMNMDLSDGRDIVLYDRTSNPIAFTTYVQNGSATTFDVGYRPVSDDVTGDINMFYNDGVDNSGDTTSISTTTKAVVITAGSSGEILTVTYPTAFVA